MGLVRALPRPPCKPGLSRSAARGHLSLQVRNSQLQLPVRALRRQRASPLRKPVPWLLEHKCPGQLGTSLPSRSPLISQTPQLPSTETGPNGEQRSTEPRSERYVPRTAGAPGHVSPAKLLIPEPHLKTSPLRHSAGPPGKKVGVWQGVRLSTCQMEISVSHSV